MEGRSDRLLTAFETRALISDPSGSVFRANAALRTFPFPGIPSPSLASFNLGAVIQKALTRRRDLDCKIGFLNAKLSQAALLP